MAAPDDVLRMGADLTRRAARVGSQESGVRQRPEYGIRLAPPLLVPSPPEGVSARKGES